jgi:hypothetical protein
VSGLELIWDEATKQLALLDHDHQIPIVGASIFYGESRRPAVVLTTTDLRALPEMFKQAGVQMRRRFIPDTGETE